MNALLVRSLFSLNTYLLPCICFSLSKFKSQLSLNLNNNYLQLTASLYAQIRLPIAISLNQSRQVLQQQ